LSRAFRAHSAIRVSTNHQSPLTNDFTHPSDLQESISMGRGMLLMRKFTLIILAALSLPFGLWAEDQGPVQKTEKTVKKTATETGETIKKGTKATARTVGKGIENTGKTIEKAGATPTKKPHRRPKPSPSASPSPSVTPATTPTPSATPAPTVTPGSQASPTPTPGT
jgi:hypothetical protein